MRVALGVIGFFLFVGGLMYAAWYASTGSQPHTTVTAPRAPPPPDEPEVRDAPTPLPALFVWKDDKAASPIALAGPRSKPAMVHLWASWCGPCRAELPSLLAFGKKGTVDVIAVSVDDHYPDVARFFGGKVPPEVVWDKTISLERALGVESIPTTFLVDTQGRVVDRFDGAQPWGTPEADRAVADDLR